MKTRILPVLLLAMLFIGCGTLYTGTVTFTQIADDTQKELAQLWVQGKITPEMDVQIGRANERYRASAAVAATALVAYKNGGSQMAYVNALIAVRASLDGLVNLIAPLIESNQAVALKKKIATATKL
jgi:hypothetical protein